TDPDNNFIESDETNNWAATPITLTQQIAGPGGSFSFTNTGPDFQFNNFSSISYTFDWYFGDGGTSNNQNPSHLYTANGTYNVTMIVYGDCGSDTVTQIITVTGVGVNESAAASLGYKVYPNPSNGNVTASYYVAKESETIFELYNVIGEKIHVVSRGVQSEGHYEFNIDLKETGIQNGVYILQLKTSDKVAAIRLVIFLE
ncbi:MAG: PKD domain-containing protein, partial [Bacteroidota bacterium]|nr:PKD domain-containing protein [Bacteroidota bacterium]